MGQARFVALPSCTIRVARSGTRAFGPARSSSAAELSRPARLLLLSRSDRHPNGLGNANDLVGRSLQGHFAAFVYGLFEQQTYDRRGPGVTIGTCRYNHGNPGIIGGSMIADDFVMLPVIFWKRALPPGLPRWGAGAKEFMRSNYRHVMRVFAPVQEIPNPDARVTLDPRVRDCWGIPVARLSGTVHDETVRTARFMREKATEWLDASGAVRTWSDPIVPRISGGQHQAGTCRMGSDARTSVTDQYGRVWGHTNLFISDASLHVTNGGFNPVLTILALSFRNGEHIARRLAGGLNRPRKCCDRSSRNERQASTCRSSSWKLRLQPGAKPSYKYSDS